MNATKHMAERMFYIFSIIILLVSIIFILRLLISNGCRKIEESQLTYHTGIVEYYYDVRGVLYFIFPDEPNITYEIDLWALDSKDSFEHYANNGTAFTVGYISDTIKGDYYKVITLECDKTVLASAQSHNGTIIRNCFIYAGGAMIFLVALICLSIGFVRTFF